MKLAPRVSDDLMGSRPPLRAYLLVLLHDRPGHGYDLLKRLEAMPGEDDRRVV